jgi:acyl-CoA synthetase (AMP-forming)/AMP-acid ligase II
MVSINPMNKERELRLLLDDSGARALVTHEALYGDVAAGVVPDTNVDVVITTSQLDYLDDVPALLEGVERTRADGTLDLLELVADHTGQRPDPVEFGPRRRRVPHLHVGHDRAPKRGDEHPRQRCSTPRPTGTGARSARATSAWPWRRCSTSRG